MKYSKIIFLSILVLIASVSVFAKTKEVKMNNSKSDVLVLYFSHSGNTKKVATYINKYVTSDIIEIKPVVAYSKNYNSCVDQAKKEKNANARPAFQNEIKDLKQYKTIFVGYPNWWGTLPMVLWTVLEKFDLSEKKIIPFCTHEGSRFGTSITDLNKLCPKSTILPGIEIRGSRVGSSEETVKNWVSGLAL